MNLFSDVVPIHSILPNSTKFAYSSVGACKSLLVQEDGSSHAASTIVYPKFCPLHLNCLKLSSQFYSIFPGFTPPSQRTLNNGIEEQIHYFLEQDAMTKVSEHINLLPKNKCVDFFSFAEGDGTYQNPFIDIPLNTIDDIVTEDYLLRSFTDHYNRAQCLSNLVDVVQVDWMADGRHLIITAYGSSNTFVGVFKWIDSSSNPYTEIIRFDFKKEIRQLKAIHVNNLLYIVLASDFSLALFKVSNKNASLCLELIEEMDMPHFIQSVDTSSLIEEQLLILTDDGTIAMKKDSIFNTVALPKRFEFYTLDDWRKAVWSNYHPLVSFICDRTGVKSFDFRSMSSLSSVFSLTSEFTMDFERILDISLANNDYQLWVATNQNCFLFDERYRSHPLLSFSHFLHCPTLMATLSLPSVDYPNEVLVCANPQNVLAFSYGASGLHPAVASTLPQKLLDTSKNNRLEISEISSQINGLAMFLLGDDQINVIMRNTAGLLMNETICVTHECFHQDHNLDIYISRAFEEQPDKPSSSNNSYSKFTNIIIKNFVAGKQYVDSSDFLSSLYYHPYERSSFSESIGDNELQLIDDWHLSDEETYNVSV